MLVLRITTLMEGFMRVITHGNGGVEQVVRVCLFLIIGAMCSVLGDLVRFHLNFQFNPRRSMTIFHPSELRLLRFAQYLIIRRK